MKAKELNIKNHPIYTRAVEGTRHQIKKDLQDVLKIQKSNGNWNYDPYMMGLANGLIMAESLITGEEPQFMSKPKKWLKDYPTLFTRIKWKIFGSPKPISVEYKNEKLVDSLKRKK